MFKKLADRAQLFAGQGKVRDPLTVFRPDQVCTQVMMDVLRPDQCHVVIVASTRQLMVDMLKQVSQSLVATVRESDAVFRYGSDEFVILLNVNHVLSLDEIATARA